MFLLKINDVLLVSIDFVMITIDFLLMFIAIAKAKKSFGNLRCLCWNSMISNWFPLSLYCFQLIPYWLPLRLQKIKFPEALMCLLNIKKLLLSHIDFVLVTIVVLWVCFAIANGSRFQGALKFLLKNQWCPIGINWFCVDLCWFLLICIAVAKGFRFLEASVLPLKTNDALLVSLDSVLSSLILYWTELQLQSIHGFREHRYSYWRSIVF